MIVLYQKVHTRPPAEWRRFQKLGNPRYLIAIFSLLALSSACSALPNSLAPIPVPQTQVQSSQANLSTPTPFLSSNGETTIASLSWDKSQLTQLISNIQALVLDGLNPADYHVSALQHILDSLDPNFAAQLVGEGLPSSVGETTTTTTIQPIETLNELANALATQAYLDALHDLAYGKVDPTQLDPDWNFTRPKVVTEADRKSAVAAFESGTLAAEFQRIRPKSLRYQQLTLALARLQEFAKQGGWPQIPAYDPELAELAKADSPTQKLITKPTSLKPGSMDSRVPLVRKRMLMAGLIDETAELDDPNLFDAGLQLAVHRFQQESNLNPDGAIGRQTLELLNVPIERRIAQLRINMEQERWYAPKPLTYVSVDVAGYGITYIQDGVVVWQSRVQVGHTERKTPILQSAITHLTLNPKWKVPPTILRKDLIPAVRKDITYLAKKHIRVFNDNGEELEADMVDWNHPGNIILRQDSGEDAALGQLVVRFPNTHSVYLHETPYKTLFNASQRAFSSGCVRVENVRELAVLLLNNAERWSREGLEAVLADGVTREVNLPRRIPVFISYWTVNIADDGYVAFRPDIYGRDLAVLEALNRKENFPMANSPPGILVNP